MKKIALFSVAAVVLSCSYQAASAATLTPAAVGEPAVGNFISGRDNLAYGPAGAVAIANTFIPEYFPENAIDGYIDGTFFPWIPADGNSEPDWLIIELPQPAEVSGVVLQGEYGNRAQGTYTIQVTDDAPPLSENSSWEEVGSYTFAGGEVPLPRTALPFPPQTVTGVRVLTQLSNGLGASVQEIELYGPFTTPPEIIAQPGDGSFVEGAYVVLEVQASSAESFQWRRDGEDIPGATGPSLVFSDLRFDQAGSYTVVISNAAGDTTSAAAVLTVTPAPEFDSYREAVLADSPFRYYPLDETSGTEAGDLSANEAGGIYAGGVTLGRPSLNEQMGTAVHFDGEPGTLVDLGLFHPGDSITIEAWVQLDQDARPSSYHAIVARWDGSYELDLAPGDIPNLVAVPEGGGFGLAAGPSSAARSQWHHIVGVYDQGVMTVYLNGVRGSDTQLPGVLQNLGPSPDRVMIGATRSGTEGSFNWKGMIDEVAIYDYALPAEKIRAHYRAALPDEGPELAITMKAEISWPSFPAGYVLQVADSLAEPVQWRDAEFEDAPILAAGFYKAYVPVEDAGKYYRLVNP